MKVAVFSTKKFEIPYIEKSNNSRHELNIQEESLDERTSVLIGDSEAVITFTNDDLSAPVLERLKEMDVKYIAARTAGIDNIDVEEAKKLDFKVANAPDYSPYAIAEHAVGLMIALNRKYILAHDKIVNHDFTLDGLVGFDMHGKTVGLIGAGKIGAVVTKILHGFGCKVLIFDPVKDDELVEKYNAEYADLDKVLKESRIISIHAPLTKDTEHLINREAIEKMQDDVILINTGRGEIIHTRDLIEGLKSGKIGAAGLDVYENEEELFFADHSDDPIADEDFAYLQSSKNVFITGHQSFATVEAIERMNEQVFDCIDKWEKGEEPENQL